MVCLGGITKNSTALGATLPNDIQCSDWAKEEVTQAYELGLIPESITRKNYKNNVTRREFCAIALRCYEKMVQKEGTE